MYRKIFPLSGSNSENYSEVRIKQIPPTIGNSQGNRVYFTDGLSTCLTSNGGGQGGKQVCILLISQDLININSQILLKL